MAKFMSLEHVYLVCIFDTLFLFRIKHRFISSFRNVCQFVSPNLTPQTQIQSYEQKDSFYCMHIPDRGKSVIIQSKVEKNFIIQSSVGLQISLPSFTFVDVSLA